MKTIVFLLSVLCAVAFGQDNPRSELRKVAVYVMDKPQDSTFLKDAVSHALNTSKKYRVVALDARAVIAAEQKRQRSGEVKEADIAELGEASGADFVCTVRRSGGSLVRASFVGVKSLSEVPGRSWMLNLPLGTDEFKSMEYIESEIHKTLGAAGTSNSQSGGGSGSANSTCPSDMVFVKGGSFIMGCTEEQSDCENDEKPTHKVTVSDFCMGKYEVTQEEWESVMGTSVKQQRDLRNKSFPLYGEGYNYPMYYVSWNESQEYIRKLNSKTGKNYRLPTEAEWEYAARGGGQSKGYKYSGSNILDNVAWHSGNSGSHTNPVGKKSPNELGIYDMSGNVWEWVSDWYGSYGAASQNDPGGASSGSDRVLRGGGWNADARYCRVANRGNNTPGIRYGDYGFRLVLSPSSP